MQLFQLLNGQCRIYIEINMRVFHIRFDTIRVEINRIFIPSTSIPILLLVYQDITLKHKIIGKLLVCFIRLLHILLITRSPGLIICFGNCQIKTGIFLIFSFKCFFEIFFSHFFGLFLICTSIQCELTLTDEIISEQRIGFKTFLIVLCGSRIVLVDKRYLSQIVIRFCFIRSCIIKGAFKQNFCPIGLTRFKILYSIGIAGSKSSETAGSKKQ